MIKVIKLIKVIDIMDSIIYIPIKVIKLIKVKFNNFNYFNQYIYRKYIYLHKFNNFNYFNSSIYKKNIYKGFPIKNIMRFLYFFPLKAFIKPEFLQENKEKSNTKRGSFAIRKEG